MKLILGSASPRRKELLREAGYSFEVLPSECDENVDKNLSPKLMVKELSLLKAQDVAKKVTDTDCLIIGADTLVSLGDAVMGKPKDRDDAIQMLRSLSGSCHQVYTGVTVIRRTDGFTVTEAECTNITFRPLSDEEIFAYVDTGEPFDKAGAYAVQGAGKGFVSAISGDYNNVVGLPVDRLGRILTEEFSFVIPSKGSILC